MSLLSKIFNWLISDGKAAQLEKEEVRQVEGSHVARSRTDARAVATRVGERGGIPEWRIVIQVRIPTADYDGVYCTYWAGSTTPPHASDVVSHYREKPQDFRFLDYLPNPKKEPKVSRALA